ncbi:hypothetical protein VPH35_071132 [Triticum aestivum]
MNASAAATPPLQTAAMMEGAAHAARLPTERVGSSLLRANPSYSSHLSLTPSPPRDVAPPHAMDALAGCISPCAATPMTLPPDSLHQHHDGRGLCTRRHLPSRSGRRRGHIHPAVHRHLPSRSNRRQGRIHPAARRHPNHHRPRRHRPGPVRGRQDLHDLPLRLPGH